jgi:hypothetical protein
MCQDERIGEHWSKMDSDRGRSAIAARDQRVRFIAD